MKIEHWHSQDRYEAEQLDYGNLLGACMGNEGKAHWDQHCDTRKGDRDLSRNRQTQCTGSMILFDLRETEQSFRAIRLSTPNSTTC